MVKVSTEDHDAETLSRTVMSVKGVKEARFTQLRQNTFMGIVKTNNCPCSKTPLPRLHILNISSAEDDELYWTILVSNHDELHNILKHLDQQAINYSVCSIERARDVWSITHKQAQLLEKALRSGFYENPRRVTLKELADTFNISPRAVAESLRRAHKKIIHQALDIETTLKH